MGFIACLTASPPPPPLAYVQVITVIKESRPRSHGTSHSSNLRFWSSFFILPSDNRAVQKTACGLFSHLLCLLHGRPNAFSSDVVVAVSRVMNIETESPTHEWLDSKLEQFRVVACPTPDNHRHP